MNLAACAAVGVGAACGAWLRWGLGLWLNPVFVLVPLGEMFPDAQFVITGALVPGSNAHGPDEFLHIPTAKGVTECVARVLGAHAAA